MMLTMATIVMFFVLASGLQRAACNSGIQPVVQTKTGLVKGTKVFIPGFDKAAHAFLNIPYAAPPVGQDRFQPPKPVKPWDGERDATRNGPACPQLRAPVTKLLDEALGLDGSDPPMSEDCLHLSVYSPSLQSSRAVMVWIHGGGHTVGWASSYDMRAYAIVEDVVAVVIQYRLGPLGWLCTEDEVIEGNMGFLDQVAALKWVQENIASFGGDPGKVTIFGESAGSWSVALHIISPASAGLFHRAIMQSGSPEDSPFFSPPAKARDTAIDLAAKLGCPSKSSKDILSCLQRQSVERILDPTGTGYIERGLLWVGRVDGKTIPLPMADLIKTAQFNTNIDLIVGVVKTEGFSLVSMSSTDFLQPEFNREKFKMKAKNLVAAKFRDSPEAWDELAERVTEEYAGDKMGDDLSLAYVDLFGDWGITMASYKTAQGIKSEGTGEVYFYEFSQRPSQSSRPTYIISDHTDDLVFMTGLSYLGRSKFSAEDKLIEKMVMKYWANFARSGNPNGEGLVHWPSLTDNNSYMILSNPAVIDQNFKAEKMFLWYTVLPDLEQRIKQKQTTHGEL